MPKNLCPRLTHVLWLFPLLYRKHKEGRVPLLGPLYADRDLFLSEYLALRPAGPLLSSGGDGLKGGPYLSPDAFLFSLFFFFLIVTALNIRRRREICGALRDKRFLAALLLSVVLVAMMAVSPVKVKIPDASQRSEPFSG